MLAETQVNEATPPERLLTGIASGSKACEQQLVENYWRALYFILIRRTNDPDLASDIAQETFLLVIKKARGSEIHKPSALAAFIRQTGINLLIAHYRKETRHNTGAIDDISIDIPSPQLDISDKLNKAQLQSIVQQVMDELPTERDRELLRRYFVYGEDKSQICAEFELKAAHFDRVLFRARSRLKQILQVKLNIDTSQVSLHHLLSVSLFYLTYSISSGEIQHPPLFFDAMLRDSHHDQHSISNNVSVRRADSLTTMPYQGQVR